MTLFAISFFLVFVSSYLTSCIIVPKNEPDGTKSTSILGLVYLFLTAFAQIVLTFEILSIFNSIKESYVLIFNILFTVISIIIWIKKGKPIWVPDSGEFRRKLINSFKLDKSLIWLYVGFCVLIISVLILNLIFPVTNFDAQSYHVARSSFWIGQGSLAHFEVSDIRNLCLPINSEILYAWVLLFVKTDIFFGFFASAGYLLTVTSLYNMMGYIGFCVRKRIWTIFILSSFSSVIVQLSGTETDIIIAGLVSASIFLFWNSLRTNKKSPIFMSALSYALAVGVKTTAFFAIPAVGTFFILLCKYHKNFKPLWAFLKFSLLNFMIFSSYNYILNYIHFSSFFGPKSFMVVSKNYYGIKGALANFIKHLFMFFDFTGFTWADYVGDHIIKARNTLLSFLGLGWIKDGLYTTGYDIQRTLIEPLMGAGILGFLVYMPCLFWAIIKPLFKPKSKKTWFIFIFAAIFVANVFVMSCLLAYMSFSIRFFMSFMLISAPILLYSYIKSNKNPLKWIIVIFSLFYMIFVSTHLWARPLVKSFFVIQKHPSITYLRYMATCKDYEKVPKYTSAACMLNKQIKENYSNKNKIIVFAGSADAIFTIKKLDNLGYKIDFRTMENAENIDFSKYNIIITPLNEQGSTYIKYYETRKNEYILEETGKLTINRRRLVPCLYGKNSTITNVKNPEILYPYIVKCGFSREFVEKNGLDIFKTIGVYTPTNKSIYVIYENKLNPPKRNNLN